MEAALGVPLELAAKVVIEPDRRVAIRIALTEAGPHDTVVIAGKGHEQGQIVGRGEAMRVLPFDDVQVAREEAA